MTHPIVLCHGIARFDLWTPALRLVSGDDSTHYFRGLKSALERRGYEVHHADVAWAGSLEQRALDLRAACARILARTGAARLNLVCHSMGGLDARVMLHHSWLARDGFQARIASISTIGTPHRGTVFADLGLAGLPGAIAAARALGLDLAGFADLTTAACARRNLELRAGEEASGVRFFTWASSQKLPRVFGPLKASWKLIAEHDGNNDGLVPVHSQLWRREYAQEQFEGDHLNQIGWWDLEELFHESPAAFAERIQAIYLRIAERLP